VLVFHALYVSELSFTPCMIFEPCLCCLAVPPSVPHVPLPDKPRGFTIDPTSP